jgi:predicted short-subunit dehydrogenase-like oxidoreductase (DUF2520 family)
MRELEREPSSSEPPACRRLAIVGRGRLGTALAATLSTDSGWAVSGPLGRGAVPDPADVDAVLLCVPDGEIAAAADLIPPGPALGHCSGATTLDVLGPERGARFSLHPLMTVTASGARFDGAGAAIAGSTSRGLEFARELAIALGMRPFEVAEADRSAYHAAASIASNFLVTLEGAAEQLAATAGVDRSLLVPLVQATVENWAALGAEQALTGPVARGDQATVEAQRAAVTERTPDLLPLFDALVEATTDLAVRNRGAFVSHSETTSPHTEVAA